MLRDWYLLWAVRLTERPRIMESLGKVTWSKTFRKKLIISAQLWLFSPMFYDAKCKKNSPNNILDSGPVTKLVLIKTLHFATEKCTLSQSMGLARVGRPLWGYLWGYQRLQCNIINSLLNLLTDSQLPPHSQCKADILLSLLGQTAPLRVRGVADASSLMA